MTEESPPAGNPTYDLSDLEDGEVEDEKPMMLGKGPSSVTPQEDVAEEEAKPVKEKLRKGNSFLKYFRGKPGNSADKGEGEKGEKEGEKEEKKEVGGEAVTTNGQPPAEDDGEQEGKAAGSAFRLKKDWSKEAKVLNKIKTSAAGTLSTVGRGAAEGGAYLFEASKRTAQATAEGFRKLKILPTPLDVLCRNESSARPCPRILLVCCTAITSKGLEEKNIFKEEAPKELVEALADHMYFGNSGVLPPQAASPHVLAAVVKHFLSNLPEPLLTNKLLLEWIAAGNEPLKGRLLMSQLPEPNLNALDIVLDTCHRIASNSDENNMDSTALAEALVPCLIWRQSRAKSNLSKGATPLVPKFMRGVSTKQGNQQPTEGDDEVIHLNDPENSESASVENPDANPMSPKKAPKVINEPLDPQETIESFPNPRCGKCGNRERYNASTPPAKRAQLSDGINREDMACSVGGHHMTEGPNCLTHTEGSWRDKKDSRDIHLRSTAPGISPTNTEQSGQSCIEPHCHESEHETCFLGANLLTTYEECSILGPDQLGSQHNSPNLSQISSIRAARAAAAQALVQNESASDRMFQRLSRAIEANNRNKSRNRAVLSPTIKAVEDNYIEVKNCQRELCCICLEDMELGDQVSMLVCSHRMHRDCAHAWLCQSSLCPLCKQTATINRCSQYI